MSIELVPICIALICHFFGGIFCAVAGMARETSGDLVTVVTAFALGAILHASGVALMVIA